MSATDKTLRNTTGSDIDLAEVGIRVLAGDTYALTLDEYLRYANPDAITELTVHINSGDIVVNNGVIDLAAADGIRFLKYPDRATIQLGDVDTAQVNTILNFEGDVSVTNEGNGKATVTIGETGDPTGKLVDFFFVASGNTADKWLGVGNGSTSSNTLPYIIPWDATLVNLTFSNQDDNVDSDVELYHNGALVYTWNVRNKRTAWRSNGFEVTFLQGDRLSCFLKRYNAGTGDPTAQDPIVEVTLSVNTANDGEGGTQYGV